MEGIFIVYFHHVFTLLCYVTHAHLQLKGQLKVDLQAVV